MKHTFSSSFFAVIGLLALQACVMPKAPQTCLTGTLLVKGTGPATKPHLHVGRELYALDFVSQQTLAEDQAIANHQGRAVTVCGVLTPEPTPLPSRLRVDRFDAAKEQVK